jgi:DNA-binding CsgD family transcriptional regulator
VNRRRLLACLAGSLVLGARAALAQRSGPARIGWLSYLPEPDPALGLLREGLRSLGHVEGKSYVMVERYANNDFTRLPALVQELVAARRVDDPLDLLSPREREVLALMAEGRSNAGIARRLWITEGTVEKHIHGAGRRADLGAHRCPRFARPVGGFHQTRA